MPDAIFADPRLASAYDAFDGERDDLAAYVGIADELGAHRVLDLGCGTGTLALLLAGTGRVVTAVDPAWASLDVARRKVGADTVRWIRGDATSLPTLSVDVAMMTGNVAQVFLSDDDWDAALRGARAALAEKGHLVFETRRPERRAWNDWAAQTGPLVREVAGVGAVEQRFELTCVDLPYVTFEYRYTFPDGAVVQSSSTLRFRTREQLETSLHSVGYEVGEVREAPDRPGKEYVFIARRL